MAEPKARILYRSCPLCDGLEIPAFLTADCSKHPLYVPAIPPTMVWCLCRTCAHVFTDGYFTPEAAALIFAKTNAHQKPGFDIENQRYVSARMIEKILPYAGAGAWLDIGFGNGSLLFTAEEYGFTPVGIDLRRENVAVVNAIGIEAHCVALEAFDQPGRFGVVSMADVLEHVPFPRQTLARVHRLLQRDGILFVSMPNMDSVLWKVLSSNNANPYWGEIEHYHNFSRQRLYVLLEEAGFAPLRFGVSERYRACMEVVARKKP